MYYLSINNEKMYYLSINNEKMYYLSPNLLLNFKNNKIYKIITVA